MNSMGTPPIVQKNRSTPGIPVSNTVTSSANDLALLLTAGEVVGQKRQRGEALRRDVAQVLGDVEHFDQACVAGAENGHVGSVGRRPAKGLSRVLHPARASRKCTVHPDHVGEERDERRAEWLRMTT